MRALLLILSALTMGGLFVAGWLAQDRSADPLDALSLDERRPAALRPEAGEQAPLPTLPIPMAPSAAGAAPDAGRASALEGPLAHVKGVVLELSLDVAADGLPAPGVEVRLTHGNQGPVLASARTGADGSFDLKLSLRGKQRPSRLQVEGDDRFRDERLAVRLRAGETLEVVLHRVRHGQIHGTTVDPQGRPLGAVQLRFDRAPQGGAIAELASDPTGRFELEGIRPRRFLSATLDGYLLERATRSRPQPRGGFSPIEVVLAPSGCIDLRAFDAEGEPLGDVFLRLEPARGFARETPRGYRKGRSVRTAPDGLGSNCGLWAERPLTAELEYLGVGQRVYGVLDGALVLHPEPHARALVVPAGGRLELVARVSESFPLSGRVLWSDGAAPSSAQVRLWEPGRPASLGGFEREQGCDAQGRFSVVLPARLAGRELRLSAEGRRPNPQVHGSASDTERVVRRTRSARGQERYATRDFRPAAGLGAFELRLEPTLSITGRVQRADGARPTAPMLVQAIAPGDPNVFARSPTGRMVPATTDSEGAFKLSPLLPGPHDLIVRDRDASPGEHIQRFPDIAAGASDVSLVLETSAPVKVLITTPEGAEVEQMVVICDRLFPRSAGPTSPDRMERIERFTDFPACPKLEFRGGRTWEDEAGTHSARSDTFDSGVAALPPTAPGWYSFGVAARGPRGDYALVSGGPYWLEAGEHEFELALVPGRNLSGHLESNAAGEHHVRLLDADGRPLSLRMPLGKVGATAKLSGSGRYDLHDVPPGSWRLIAGPESELDAGRALHALDVRVEASRPRRRAR